MVGENPIWGEERIANELWLKLGIRVSPRTVRAYWPIKDPGSFRQSQNWRTFARNHTRTLLACDFMVAVTARFRILYIFVVMEIGSRRILHCNVTPYPLPNGRCNNYAKRYQATMNTASSFMIDMRRSQQNWTQP